MKRIGKTRTDLPTSPIRLIGQSSYYLLAVLLALELKLFYSRAGADDLAWVLTPTASLVEIFTGISFVKEAQAGFISTGQGIIIAPACAGINFLIIAFVSLSVASLKRMRSPAGKLAWLGLAAGIAYLATLGVNALRISAAVVLFHSDIYGVWITPERVHRITGVLIYCICLLVLHSAGEWVAGWFVRRTTILSEVRPSSTSGFAPFLATCGVPLLCYALITVGIPLANRSSQKGHNQFVEHCCVVLVMCAAVALLSFLFSVGWYKVGSLVWRLKRSVHRWARVDPGR